MERKLSDSEGTDTGVKLRLLRAPRRGFWTLIQPTRLRLYVFNYIDNIARGEFVNVAICLVEDRDGSDSFVGFEMINNWKRVEAFFPTANTELLKTWCSNLRKDILAAKDKSTLPSMLGNLSNNLSVTVQASAILTTDPVQEMKTLTATYLD